MNKTDFLIGALLAIILLGLIKDFTTIVVIVAFLKKYSIHK